MNNTIFIFLLLIPLLHLIEVLPKHCIFFSQQPILFLQLLHPLFILFLLQCRCKRCNFSPGACPIAFNIDRNPDIFGMVHQIIILNAEECMYEMRKSPLNTIQQFNKIKMNHDYSRLSSITEQQVQNQPTPKTEVSLMRVYHSLYAIDFLINPLENSQAAFADISAKVEANALGLIQEEGWNKYQENSESESKQRYLEYFERKRKEEMKQHQKQMYMDKQVLMAKLKQSNYRSKVNNRSPIVSKQKSESIVDHLDPSIKIQTQITISSPQKKTKQTIQSSAIQNISKNSPRSSLPSPLTPTTTPIKQILHQLSSLDEERSLIKSHIYTQQSQTEASSQASYREWSALHSRMKETLEIYIDKIGQGRSLPEIYQDMQVKRGKMEGYSYRELYGKLDGYLQALFLDERELMIALGERKGRRESSVRSVPEPRRKLVYE